LNKLNQGKIVLNTCHNYHDIFFYNKTY
jgi:hypothetical protein